MVSLGKRFAPKAFPLRSNSRKIKSSVELESFSDKRTWAVKLAPGGITVVLVFRTVKDKRNGSSPRKVPVSPTKLSGSIVSLWSTAFIENVACFRLFVVSSVSKTRCCPVAKSVGSTITSTVKVSLAAALAGTCKLGIVKSITSPASIRVFPLLGRTIISSSITVPFALRNRAIRGKRTPS